MVIYTVAVNTESSQRKEFEEPSHHDISVRWWNTNYQMSCLSTDSLEKQ